MSATYAELLTRKANYLAAPTKPDLLADIAVAQPAKPKARIRTKPSKGGGS